MPIILYLFSAVFLVEITFAEIFLLGLSAAICSSTVAIDISDGLEGTTCYEVRKPNFATRNLLESFGTFFASPFSENERALLFFQEGTRFDQFLCVCRFYPLC